ncbi:hypothetical protein RHSIM_Rhsim01G0002600 [Rhododendron simsii]|uniref:FRIGIDA-like protein n=1 Tax=Rhododendron simsii TaxID=118357 RepID=A0A834HIJ8_RHOSS|nr:hypothetical protein RHSIM_Rhsim01G0002600 [Rhododendron simsii]
MALSDRISANMKLNASKKNSLRNAILILALEWKDFDEQLDSTDDCFGECINELNCREKNLESLRESVKESNRELDLVRKSIESRADELEIKEKEFRSFIEVHTKLLKLKEKQLDEIRRSAEERIEEAELREERLNDQQKLMEGLLLERHEEKERFETIQKSIGQRLEEISSKEKYFKGRSKEIDSIQNWIERRAKELDSREEQIDERFKELDSMRKLNEKHCKELELKEKEVDSAKLWNEERAGKLDSREKELDSVKNFISQSFEDIHSKIKQLKLDQQLIEERSKGLELKEKLIDEWSKELELKKKQFDGAESNVKVEQVEGMPVDNVNKCLSADTQFVVKMDGRSLQLFLNEHSNDHESVSSEVYRALQLSLDPAKLVLDAMEGFYPPHLKKGDAVFEEDVVRRSCILLLEQLMKIAPQIHPYEKGKALKLAGEWKEKMGAVASNTLEVLGFMQLLASYKLASGFDTDELLKIFMVVAEHKQAPELCRELGFTEKVPGLIDVLVMGDQVPVAVRFIFAFKLVDKFPPVPLLRCFLKRSKRIAKEKINMEKNPSTAKYRVIDERVTYVRAVIKCVVDHNLESQLPLKSLEQRIEQLLMHKVGDKQIKPARLIKTEGGLWYRDNTVMSSTTVPMQSKASASMHDPATHTLACILANMDGKNLQLFLNEHLEENQMMHRELYDALQMLSDSGKLVLDAMQGFYPPHSKKGGINIEASVVRRSCIYLLEILMRLSPPIKPHVKEAAMKLAVFWKEKTVVVEKNLQEILGFLLLVGTYGLASAFDTDELRSLFQTVVEHRYASLLSQALGFPERIPVDNILDIHEKIDQSALENLQLNSIVPSSDVGPSNLWGGVPACIQFASDPAKLVLDAMQCCYHSNLGIRKRLNMNVIKNFSLLLIQLLRAPLAVKTCVKEGAMKFASDWKDNLKPQSHLEAWPFLLFLATYKVASSFDTSELLDLLEMVYYRKQAIDLFHALGLKDELPNFVNRLIQRALHLDAIRYIYAFDLIDKFPPASLLKRYFSHVKEVCKDVRREGRNSREAQEMAIKKEVAALNMMINCITSHGLESQYSPMQLKERVGQLLRQKTGQRSAALLRATKAQPTGVVDKRIVVKSKAQPQEEAHRRASMTSSPCSLSQTQEPQCGKKRFAQIPDHDVSSSTQQLNPAKKLCRKDLSTSGGVTNSNHLSSTCPTPIHQQCRQQPVQHPPAIFASETEPYLRAHSGHYSLGGASTPVPGIHMSSHLASQHGSGIPASGGFPPFGTQFGSAPNFNARPFKEAGTPYYSWSFPN